MQIRICFLVISLRLLLAAAENDSAELEPQYCGLQKVCVPRHLCDAEDNVIENGVSLMDFRTISNVIANNQGCKWTQLCCSLKNRKDPDPVKEEDLIEPGQCGHANPHGISVKLTHLSNGESQFSEYPWMVLLLVFRCENDICRYKPIGGGALLSSRVVLTTAHNIDRIAPSDLYVRAGEWDLSSDSETLRHQDGKVQKMIIHENFSGNTGNNDVALIVLETPFKLDRHVATICLPNPNTNFEGSHCIVNGWGQKTFKDKNFPSIMKKVEIPVLSRAKCNQLLQRTRLGPFFQLSDTFICAGGERGKDACLGDGGAPLVCPIGTNPTRYAVAGLVSWGIDCGQPNVPGVYTNIQQLLPWIKEKFELYSFADLTSSQI